MTMPMFDPPEPGPEPPRPKTRRTTTCTDRPSWQSYHPHQHVPCDDCLLVLHENHGVGPFPQPARWKRQQGDSTLLLCYAHARAWRADDSHQTKETPA